MRPSVFLRKSRTALRTISNGNVSGFMKLMRRNVLGNVFRTHKVRVGPVHFRMYANTEDEYVLVEDARELSLLGLIGGRHFSCIYDIGANVGMHSLYYSHIADQ